MKHKLYATLAVLAFNIIAIFAIRWLIGHGSSAAFEFAGMIAVLTIYADVLFYKEIKELKND